MVEEPNIRHSLELVKSSSYRSRQEGLTSLRAFFRDASNSSKIEKFHDQIYYGIFEAIFACTWTERTTYLKVTGNVLRNTAGSRLSACASTLRTVVEAGVQNIRIQTIDALVEHIINALDHAEHGLFEPLLGDYSKALKALLDWNAHVEHMHPRRNTLGKWNDTLDFCLEAVRTYLDSYNPTSSITSNGHSAVYDPSFSASRLGKSFNSQVGSRSHTSSSPYVDFIACIRKLVEAPNAPIVSPRAQSILTTLVEFIQSSSAVGRGHLDAAIAIRCVVARLANQSADTLKALSRRLLPLVKDLWTNRRAALREELVASILLLEPYILSLAKDPNESSFREDLESVFETLSSDYARSHEKELLQLDDLDFHTSSEKKKQNREGFDCTFSLRTKNEYQYATVLSMSSVLAILQQCRQQQDTNTARDFHISPRMSAKKSRGTDQIGDLYRKLQLATVGERLCALQTLSFLAGKVPMNAEALADAIPRAITLIGDSHPSIPSWSMLFLSVCAIHDAAGSSQLVELWAAVWQAAVRVIPNVAMARTASLLLNTLLKRGLVIYSSISASVQAMFSTLEVNSPAAISDASISLWITLIAKRLADAPGSGDATFSGILQWIFTKWTPSKLFDRAYASNALQTYDVRDLLDLLGACLSLEASRSQPSSFPILGPLMQTLNFMEQNEDLTRYLMLQHTYEPQQVAEEGKLRMSRKLIPAPTRSFTIDNRIIIYCVTETEKLIDDWRSFMLDRQHSFTSDILRIVTAVCLVNSALIGYRDSNDPRVVKLEKATRSLIDLVSSYISRPECDQQKVDTVLLTFSRVLPDVKALETLDITQFRRCGALPLAVHLTKALNERRALQNSAHHDENDNMTDLDNGFESQGSLPPITKAVHRSPRDVLSADHEILASRVCTTLYLHLLSVAFEASGEDDTGATVPQAFFEHLTSLPDREFCASGPFMLQLVRSHLHLQWDDCQTFLEHLAVDFLEDYEHERNEVILVYCLELVDGLASKWTVQLPLVDNIGYQIYDYLVKIVQRPGLASPALQSRAATLFHHLDQLQPDFESARVSLLKLLSQSSVPVQYHVAKIIPHLFGDSILAEHDELFDKVHQSLPHEITEPEGIAIRLFALAQLGSKWFTLLRRCIYHIFETPATIPLVIGHAAMCMSMIAQSLKLEGSRSLFRLFAGQVLFTWGESDSLDSVPFQVFGYSSLYECFYDAQDEIVAQSIMRRRSSDLEAASTILKIAVKELALRSFGKAAAYSLAKDLTKANSQDETGRSSEQYLRDLTGKELYGETMATVFHEILASLLIATGDIDNVEKIYARKGSKAVADVIDDIKSFSHSEADLPPSLQPSFPARNLPALFERLAKRISSTPRSLWSESRYAFVLRALLNTMDQALGPLNACAVLRKIRVLLGFAGEIGTSGYQLQMCLHALRPLLTDQHCAEDAIGLVQYLYVRGRTSLQANLAFVTGSAVMTLLSGWTFLSSSQQQTTQDSHHQITMKRAKDFREWLFNYMNALITTPKQSEILRRAALLLTNAEKSSCQNAAEADSPEAKLLLQLYDESHEKEELLIKPISDVILQHIQQSFLNLPPPQNDVLASNIDACNHAYQIWATTTLRNTNTDYCLWAARSLGRAFDLKGASRSFAMQMISHNPVPSMIGSTSTSETDKFIASVNGSGISIIRAIYGLLHHHDPKRVMSAEESLRQILNRSFEKNDWSYDSIGLVLPHEVQTALYLPQASKKTYAAQGHAIEACAGVQSKLDVDAWIQRLVLALSRTAKDDPILGSLGSILDRVPSIAKIIFPEVMHLALILDNHGNRSVRAAMSKVYQAWLSSPKDADQDVIKLLFRGLLYLRKKPHPAEATNKDRDLWIEFDPLLASQAAAACGMYSTALLYAEAIPQTPQKSRRSSSVQYAEIPSSLLLLIYQNIADPDSFYGLRANEGLRSALEQFDYEGDGYKSLLFRGAKLDSQYRQGLSVEIQDVVGLTRSLMDMNLNSMSQMVLSDAGVHDPNGILVDSTLTAAQKLGQWDVKVPDRAATESSIIFGALQGLRTVTDYNQARAFLEVGYLDALKLAKNTDAKPLVVQEGFRAMAVLSEIDEILSAQSSVVFEETLKNLEDRHRNQGDVRFDDIRSILSARQSLLGVLYHSEALQKHLHVSRRDIRRFEIQSLLFSSASGYDHDDQRENLTTVTYLQDMAVKCREHGIEIQAAADYETARVLAERKEHQLSIRILQNLACQEKLEQQEFSPGYAKVLASLAYQVSEARLEKPQEILQKYLNPAVKELNDKTTGVVAGEVFHIFASFCDEQLQNVDNREEFLRTQRTRDQREKEMEAFREFGKTVTSKSEKAKLSRAYAKCRSWFKLEDDEYKRLRSERETFLKMSIENYLRSLAASDKHDNNVLRLVALWLEFADSSIVNSVVEQFLAEVQSRKFAGLMHQLCSRLQSDGSLFQKLLANLVFRICRDHPFHGLYQLYSNTTPPRVQDEAAKSRHAAAIAIADHLKGDKRSSPYWKAVRTAHDLYDKVAMYKDKTEFQVGHEHNLSQFPVFADMAKQVPKLGLPPPTLAIELRADSNYEDVPRIGRFGGTVKIAGGLSAPKILSVIATDGKRYFQLLKGGTDDLRQDAIMEQVFEQVSGLLKKHPKTRQRSLQIRTYKVIPLSAISGVIEFVSDTIPLQDVVIPMHEKYFPKDIKHHNARRRVGDAAQDNTATRIKTYQEVCGRFNPAMRFWFLERFLDPEEWFEKRLAYTRSTAANSILGYIVGLGDRHLHNILIDSVSGEVVHIDLGIAFEAGRVLGVPEIVPFRLTRDVVDGMGHNKVEGVFRRCCEFTMDALRAERVSIMTLLNVLRYDPLCTWTVSPLKARKIQDDEEDEQAGGLDEISEHASKTREDDIGEANRALSVVEKKLSSSLSTTATVNELIQQAMDERNLALMFSGWAAYV